MKKPPVVSLPAANPPENQSLKQGQNQSKQPLEQSPQGKTRIRRLAKLLLMTLGVLFIAFMGLLNYSATRRMKDIIPQPFPAEVKPLPSLGSTTNWKKFTIASVNLEFRLPPALSRFGELEEHIKSYEPAFRGTELCAAPDQLLTYRKGLCDFENFGIFAISDNYAVGRGASFSDFQGYMKTDTGYVGRITSKYFKLTPELLQELTNQHGVQILKVYEQTDSSGEDFPTPGEGWIGAIVNTPDRTFPGFTVQMELEEGLTEETFDQILSTFRFDAGQ